MGHPQTTVRLKLRDEPDAARKLRAAVCDVAASTRLPPAARFDLKLAATEAFANAIKGPGHAVEVAITASDESVEVELTDRGRFAPEPRTEGPLEVERGRGIPLMLALADEVEFTSLADGTRVRIRKRAPYPGESYSLS